MGDPMDCEIMDPVPDYLKKSVLVFGCGNILFGDDGFGPAVIEHFLDHFEQPENSCIMNVGGSVRELLFDIAIGDRKPDRVIIIDAVDKDREPGTIFEISVDDLPKNKTDDYSMHQVPTSNLLRELRDICNIDVRVLVCQTEHIPEEVEPGLSDTMQNAVPGMCAKLVEVMGE